MRQRKICEYFGLSCTHLRSFLCLPQSVRHRIYREAGLLNDTDIDLNRRPGADFWPSIGEFEISYNLLLTCRAIYTEVLSSLYSTNRFFIRYRDSWSLQALTNLTAASLSSLTHLTVHLNVASCEIGRSCCDLHHPEKPHNCHQHDRPLRISSLSHRAILHKWKSLAMQIMAHTTPYNLRLHFVCDVEDLEAAFQAVEPLLSTRTLADCAIRLGRKPNPRIQDLACTTATRAKGNVPDRRKSPFRFLDLPPELRRQIFEYTDLVTPLCEVEWNPKDGFYLRYSTWRCAGDLECPPNIHRACEFRNCWESRTVGCFCRRFHAAFSSICHCWSPPTYLFLVCHAVLEDSRMVFFEKNRFIITPAAGCNYPAENTPPRLEASIFLMDVAPPNALYFLRFLELAFPPFHEDYLCTHEPAYKEWLRTVDQVKEQLCLPILTVRVYMADYLPRECTLTHFRAHMTKEQGMTILKTYARTLAPLSKLKGLRRFFAHLAWPFAWTRSGRQRRHEDPEFVAQQIRAFEEKCERLVMGNDFEINPLQKEGLGNSQWLEVALISNEYV